MPEIEKPLLSSLSSHRFQWLDTLSGLAETVVKIKLTKRGLIKAKLTGSFYSTHHLWTTLLDLLSFILGS